MEDKILDVRNLRISFRTANGKVQAVRDISFSLTRGETLAIVGESGSGKSVTSRSILGILAPNAIVEGGEIIYDGKDLLKLSEEDFHLLRGEKLSMIFQDPLSSLDPIVKVGKQLTEAMIIKGRAKQRASRKEFNAKLQLLNRCMDVADGETPEAKKANKERCKKFDTFEYKHIELENAYNTAKECVTEAVTEIDNALFEIEKNALKDVVRSIGEIARLALGAIDPYVVREDAEHLTALAEGLTQAAKTAKETGDNAPLVAPITEIKGILAAADAKPAPNFFAMGYYLTFSPEALARKSKWHFWRVQSRLKDCRELQPELDVPELNRFLRSYLDEHFMLDFIAAAKQGVAYSFRRSEEAKQAVLTRLKDALSVFSADAYEEKAIRKYAKELIAEVEESIDRLAIVKDDTAYTFRSGLTDAVDFYFRSVRRNEKERKRFEAQSARHDRMLEKGRKADWKVVPADIVDLNVARDEILLVVRRLIEDYEASRERAEAYDLDKATVAMIDYLKETASAVVFHVSKRLAKTRALKLMEEVGIPEPRKRYKQYPFEFSGGMRQRIVIAIALAANPDILICDEPTTALDVTIQAQILELINRLKRERGLSVIFITHDLGVVANMADRVAVMYAGKIVEYGKTEEVFYAPAHPYTWALLSSMPDLDTKEKLEAIPGTPPNMIYPPKGDAFAPRNKYAMKIDFEEQPPMFAITDTHHAATWLLHPDAPKVEPPKIVTERIARMRAKAGGGEPV